MKQRVSSDHLPPTSAAKTTSLARPCVPESSGYVLSLQRRLQSSSLAMWDSISVQGRDQSCVNGQLSPVNGQPLCDHFKATTVNTTHQVQVPHENIGGDTSSNLTADACRSRLQREAASSKHPRSRARCAVVAKDVERTATPAGTRRKRERKTTSRGRTAQDKSGGRWSGRRRNSPRWPMPRTANHGRGRQVHSLVFHICEEAGTGFSNCMPLWWNKPSQD